MNTTDLEGVYKQLAFDKIVAQSKLEAAAKERLKQADDGVLEAKRAASVVSGVLRLPVLLRQKRLPQLNQFPRLGLPLNVKWVQINHLTTIITRNYNV